MMLVGYANGATLRMGDSYLLPSIASVVIGGSSILGGRGSFAGTVGGAILSPRWARSSLRSAWIRGGAR